MPIESRITDPRSIDRSLIAKIVESGRNPTIQFSAPGYDGALLRQVNAACAEFDARIEVRFYGHYSQAFDGDALVHLPDIRWLSVDCLTRIANPRRIAALPRLTRLSFGVHDFDEPDFVAAIGVERFTRLSLGETRKRNFDLAPLAGCGDLETLSIEGHHRNIAAIARLPRLRTLTLRAFPNREDLAFLCDAPALRHLTLVLGGRTSIEEFSHPALEALAILRVRGLAALGPIARFPGLRRLQVEDQIQLDAIDLAGAQLERLSLYNCKTLGALPGLETLAGLREFRASMTALDPDALLHREWPPTLQALALFSGNRKWNDHARAEAERRGYAERLKPPIMAVD